MSGRVASTIAALAAVAALVVGIVLGTHAAGGSDSSCYLNASRLIARGRVAIDEPLVRQAPWKDAAKTFTPAGFVPSSRDRAVHVPICAPGLPLLMAAFRILHVSEFLVVPLLGALVVWLTFIIGRRIDAPLTAACAAALVASSPTFLYQVVQPMSDVPAAAWWLLALACAIERDDGWNHPLFAGLAASMAILTRPNLLPLAAVIGVYMLAAPSRWRRTTIAAAFIGGVIPGLVVLAMLQRAMYGSPLSTGYGNAAGLMTAGNVIPNATRYVGWLLGAHTPFLALALGAPWVLRHPRHAWFCLAVAGTTLACYLPYLVFDDWWYTRFLLPAIPLLVVLGTAVLMAMIARITVTSSPAARMYLFAACMIATMALWIDTARTRHAFSLSASEHHYYEAGRLVADRVSETAAILTVRDSGSVRYYTGRPTVSWDTIDGDQLDQTIAFLREQGYAAYLLLERDEEAVFRTRFHGASAVGKLDWPPRVQVGRVVRLYAPMDRPRYLADGRVRIEYLDEPAVPPRDWRRWFR